MCGIAGFLSPRPLREDGARTALGEMLQAILHRGPDAGGMWSDAEAGIALGHRRLSILDLSEAGNQPMPSPSGRYILSFNGEIYNHLDLRRDLGIHAWRGHSDTETLAAGIEKWGLGKTLERAAGMFALAVWDRSERKLMLARDRIGEKPLYYGWQGNAFLFGSELKALRRHPAFVGGIDRSALAAFVQVGYVPGRSCIVEGLRKLPSGTWLRIDAGCGPGTMPDPVAYWSLRERVGGRSGSAFRGTPEEAVRAFEEVLTRAVREQSVADVPLGAFLSGGIDSSTIVALMQSCSTRPVKTFTIGFEEKGYDEAAHAAAIAKHLSTEHTGLYINHADARDIIPELPRIYDEPFADLSQIPTVLVSRLARGKVTVALSGDGGDELFCGYGRYGRMEALWGRLSRIPAPVRRFAAGILPGPRLRGTLAAREDGELYRFFNMQWKDFPDVVPGAGTLEDEFAPPESLGSTRERMMFRDMLDYLPGAILAKVDRAAMSASLETRIPLLDHRVVEFAWSLPLDLKVRGGTVKWPLRMLLRKHVPDRLVERPKMGFGVPMHSWLRGGLRGWAEDLLSEDRLKRDGWFDASAVRGEWNRHLEGGRDRHYSLWSVLMFNAWMDHWSAVGSGRPARLPEAAECPA